MWCSVNYGGEGEQNHWVEVSSGFRGREFSKQGGLFFRRWAHAESSLRVEKLS